MFNVNKSSSPIVSSSTFLNSVFAQFVLLSFNKTYSPFLFGDIFYTFGSAQAANSSNLNV